MTLLVEATQYVAKRSRECLPIMEEEPQRVDLPLLFQVSDQKLQLSLFRP